MASQLERRKRLWENFKAHHLKSFYGIWTRFDPYTGEAFDSHKSQRQFWKEDEAGTRVVQKNTHFYEGKDPQVRGPWNFTFDETVLCDGFFHPMSNAVRGYFLQNGDAGWISTTALNGQAFMNELFFCQVGHVRASVACAYVEGAKLTRVALIREDTQGWPCSLDPNAAEPLTKVPDDWPSAGLQLVGREVIQTGIIIIVLVGPTSLCLQLDGVHHLCRLPLLLYRG